jgi:predicted exporter/lauroyl/myristoyl acyltransferase
MRRGLFRCAWLLLLIPLALGVARLRFDAEVLDLLPANVRAVQGLKIYQQHFANARQLILTIDAKDADQAEKAARSIAEALCAKTNLVLQVTWQPPWLEHPEQTAELVGYLWLNQPPRLFSQLGLRLQQTNLASLLAATRRQLATTFSPLDIAQLSYDPFGLTRLPESGDNMAAGFGQGQSLFVSSDGRFRIIFIDATSQLAGYRECIAWLGAVKTAVQAAVPPDVKEHIGYTGRPAFVAEISSAMKHDMTLSVGGTSVIIAVLFWFAHRRFKPMLWLLALLALILAATLALGGLVFGTVNVVSMGFAAILLGLAVDYALVHYQEAVAHPGLSVPEIRRAIAPGIFWAATTTITAFLVLNFGGLPGLAQLGSLVAIGVALSALVMIFAFLPPLFPDRMRPASNPSLSSVQTVAPLHPRRVRIVFAATAALALSAAVILWRGWPGVDATADALQPRGSPAFAALEAIKNNLGQKHDPLWLIVQGRNESEVAQRLDAVLPPLQQALSNGTLASMTLPNPLWPRPQYQSANRAAALQLAAQSAAMRDAALANGFSENALVLTTGILDTWRRAAAATNVFWPTNQLSSWIFDKLTARGSNQFFAAGFLFPGTNGLPLAPLESRLPPDGVWLSSWELLGATVLDLVKANMWKLLLPMASLILLSLSLAFRRWTEIFISLGVLLLSGLCLLAVMSICRWSWNLLNLMAIPLILGTGVDYSIFMQLALRRRAGDLALVHRSVGRALLLCGATAAAAFGSLGLSSNAGMASLGRVCAFGIAANMLLSVFLLPVWWRFLLRHQPRQAPAPKEPEPSQFYRAGLWNVGLALARLLPPALCGALAKSAAAIYCRLAPHRRQTVICNLLPVLDDDAAAARRGARQLFEQFALKLVDLWRYEGGAKGHNWFADWQGWEHFAAAQARGNGVLLVTPHLGNWELGGAFLVERGCNLLVLTQPEPDQRLTHIRRLSRARWGVETLVVGEDIFAFVDIIRRLQQGATVALLMDRPPKSTAVTVNLFGRPFLASIAAAELARASGCAIVPSVIVRIPRGYRAYILPEIAYDRPTLRNRAERIKLTQQIQRVFEPAIRQYPTQWFHFVPIWPSPQ